MAGRLAHISIAGFSQEEVGAAAQAQHWLRGGFPLSFLAPDDLQSFAWRRDFVRTFLERDVPQFGVTVASALLGRFWSMVAHQHGQIWNGAAIAQSLGISQPTVRRYLDLLTDLFMIRQLAPWYANLKKRQVKSPKIYLRDTGLLHQILGIRTETDLLDHPRSGASWEGYVLEEVLRAVCPDEAYFWSTHQGAEIDLVLRIGGRMFGVECKRTDAPRMTPSIRIALDDLGLERVAVIYPGPQRYVIDDRVEAVPAKLIAGGVAAIFPAR